MDIRNLIEKVFTAGGSELHMKIGSKPLMRKNNALKPLDLPALVEEDMKGMIEELLSKPDMAKFEKNGVFEVNNFGGKPCNFRLSLFHSQQKPVAFIKIINSNIPSLSEIGFPEILANQLSSAKGLFILSGPSRSEVSTSLAALVEFMNSKFRRHILIIEDPIVYNYVSKESVISQRQFSKDIYMVEQAINFARRMDVDTLVIGDLKREVPYKNIIEYVAGGHLVLLCMPTLGVVNTMEKFVLSFPEAYRNYVNSVITENLLGVCSQGLITNSSGVSYPVHEVFIPNRNSASFTTTGKYSRFESNISTTAPGSKLFATSVADLVSKGKVDKASADAFLERLKANKA